jgi:hypothetical protein
MTTSKPGARRVIALGLHTVAVVSLCIADPPRFAPPDAVPDGGRWLQRAVDHAQPGDVIQLQPGATYVGHIVLPARRIAGPPIVIRTAGHAAVRPGVRVTPAAAVTFAKLGSPDRGPALRTLAGAAGWRIELVEFLPTREGRGDIIALGSPRQRDSEMPHDIELDRLYVHGDPWLGQRRGVSLNSRNTSITNSHISGIGARHADSQAIAGWNGAGGYRIANNYLEAAGENVMFGGADPSIDGLVPTRIDIRGNHLTKQPAWRDGRWGVKNLLELKNAADVTVEDNVLERNWRSGQSGYSVLLTVRNQNGGCPWCIVRDIRFERNVIRDVAAGISITGGDNNYPSGRTSQIVIRDNVVSGLDGPRWGGDGFFLQLLDGPADVVVDRNTIVEGPSGGIVKIEGPAEGFVFTRNLTGHGAFGIIATDHAPGRDSIAAMLPGANIRGNVIAGGNPALYPPDNLFPSVEQFREHVRTPDGSRLQWMDRGAVLVAP